ncbi:MAG: hypothetical protein J6U06_01430 [Spirochaetaceae bacterium]|nr:hypothetical protein [Spirochaetaceae bacterium]
MTNNKENMQKDKVPSLKSLDICGFKTFVEPTHIEFAQGLNVVLATTKYPVPSGMWDFFDAIRWAFRAKQHHGSKNLSDTASSEVKLTIADEYRKELSLISRISNEKGEEFITDASQEEISRLQKYLLKDGDKSLVFGSTKIVAANSDKQIATQADGMIGITTDEAGMSKAFVLSREKD